MTSSAKLQYGSIAEVAVEICKNLKHHL